MKEIYIAPVVELICLRADAALANSNDLDFDSFLQGEAEGEVKPPMSNQNELDLPLK